MAHRVKEAAVATVTVEATITVLEPHRSLPPAELAAAVLLARYREESWTPTATIRAPSLPGPRKWV